MINESGEVDERQSDSDESSSEDSASEPGSACGKVPWYSIVTKDQTGSTSDQQSSETEDSTKTMHRCTWENIETLRAMGYNMNIQIYAPLLSNKDLLKYLNTLEPNFHVKIGNRTFGCRSEILTAFSPYFKEHCTGKDLVRLPKQSLSAEMFQFFYDWSIYDLVQIYPDFLIIAYKTAIFLRVSILGQQVRHQLKNNEMISEQVAFDLYLRCNSPDLQSLQPLLLSRVSRYFLTVVAKDHFLEMSSSVLAGLLRNDRIGVNNEVEVLFVVIRWLSHQWPARKKHLLLLMSLVRFGLMAPSYLLLIQKSPEPCMAPYLDDDGVRKLIADGLAYTAVNKFLGEQREQLAEFTSTTQLEAPEPRCWVDDERADHHHKPDCPYLRDITYADFQSYLALLKEQSDAWHFVHFIEDLGGWAALQCCTAI